MSQLKHKVAFFVRDTRADLALVPGTANVQTVPEGAVCTITNDTAAALDHARAIRPATAEEQELMQNGENYFPTATEGRSPVAGIPQFDKPKAAKKKGR